MRCLKINQMNSDSRSTWGLPSEETRLELDGTNAMFLGISVENFNWSRVELLTTRSSGPSWVPSFACDSGSECDPEIEASRKLLCTASNAADKEREQEQTTCCSANISFNLSRMFKEPIRV